MKRTLSKTTDKGKQTEQRVEQFLLAQGLTLRARNFSKPSGEIDLIMQDGNTLVFVEVRLRKAGNQVSAVESVDYRKQQRLIRTANWYLQSAKLYDKCACRFDVVATNNDGDGEKMLWVKDAFSAF